MVGAVVIEYSSAAGAVVVTAMVALVVVLADGELP